MWCAIKARESATMFCIQTINYLMATVNYRLIGSGSVVGVAITDAMIATFAFLIIRRIARSETALHLWAGYAGGGMFGGVLGMLLSEFMGA